MKAIVYLRVSTKSQSESGLGLEAQRQTVSDFLDDVSPVAEYQEIESGRKTDRPQLRAALNFCRRTGATLVIAKVDRLARNARFLLALIDSGVEITFCDLPQVSGPAGRMMLVMMSGFAEMESALISTRTKSALAMARKRGVKLGAQPGNSPLISWNRNHSNKLGVGGIKKAADRRAESWRSTITALVSDGLSDNAIAKTLTARGEKSVKGKAWTSKGVSRLRARLEAIGPAPAMEMGF